MDESGDFSLNNTAINSIRFIRLENYFRGRTYINRQDLDSIFILSCGIVRGLTIYDSLAPSSKRVFNEFSLTEPTEVEFEEFVDLIFEFLRIRVGDFFKQPVDFFSEILAFIEVDSFFGRIIGGEHFDAHHIVSFSGVDPPPAQTAEHSFIFVSHFRL